VVQKSAKTRKNMNFAGRVGHDYEGADKELADKAVRAPSLKRGHRRTGNLHRVGNTIMFAPREPTSH
jgi:hypothetical protein